MYKKSEFTKEFYKPKDVANYLNVSVRTIQNYGNAGTLTVERNVNNRRYIKRENLLAFLDKLHMLYDDTSLVSKTKKNIVYARVSSHEQKAKGDLDRQALYVIENIPEKENLVILKEVGSGLNDKRPKLLQIISMVLNDEVAAINITYRDRLTRFGFNYIQTICNEKGVTINILKSKKDKEIEAELVEDMMSLIASFSGKLYGLRSRKNKTKER